MPSSHRTSQTGLWKWQSRILSQACNFTVSHDWKSECPARVLTLSQSADPAQTPPSPWDMQPNPGWLHTGQTRPAELIPCEWQSHQNRRKRRDMKRSGMARSRPKSTSPSPTPPPGRTVLRVGNRDLLRRYYEKAFEDFQQLNCRAIAKSYIKLVEPRKQVHFPYNGRKVISGVSQRVDPELTKPGWWPADVLHREPDHLLKRGKCASATPTDCVSVLIREKTDSDSWSISCVSSNTATASPQTSYARLARTFDVRYLQPTDSKS